MANKARILVWDVETSDIELLIRTYGLKNTTRYFHPDTIKRDWTMLGAAWKWLGDTYTHCVSVRAETPLDDSGVIRALHSALSSVDVLVGHNSDRFDIKKFNTRCLYLGLPPIQHNLSVDTLKLARKHFAFTSNKLSYIAKYLGPPAKDESPDWERVIAGYEDELRAMRAYNKQDVIVTEQVYLKLVQFATTHPNIAAMQDLRDIAGMPVMACKVCGSTDVVKEGVRWTAAGRKRQTYFCKSHKGYFST